MGLNRQPRLDKQYVVYQCDDGAQFYLRKDMSVRGALMTVAGTGTYLVTRAEDSDAVDIQLLEPTTRSENGVEYGGANLLALPQSITPRYLNLQYADNVVYGPQSHAEIICSFISDWERFEVAQEIFLAGQAWTVKGKVPERQLRGF